MSYLVSAFIFAAVLPSLAADPKLAATSCIGMESCPWGPAAQLEAEIERQEDLEAGAMEVRLLQTKKQQISLVARTTEAEQKDAHNATTSAASKDQNGNLCVLCHQPKPERLGGKVYKEFRTDCGKLSSPKGPSSAVLQQPVSSMLQKGQRGERATNGFCELNFAKSCVDAVANGDYLYWAKSLDFDRPAMRKSAVFDARYCHLNGFLEKEIVALQHNFTGMQAKAKELCETKYAKYGIEKLSFASMMSKARYSDDAAPLLEEAEFLAAWNCAMGDLGCDMTGCAYSFCSAGQNTYGVYSDCPGWHPVNGMPVDAAKPVTAH